MKEISVKRIEACISKMVQTINFEYPNDVLSRLEEGLHKETSITGKASLQMLMENACIAKEEKIPICQDTGMVIVFLKIGQEVHLIDGSLKEAIENGVRKGYKEGYLRKSIVCDPVFDRMNTKDNTPCIIYTDIVDGDKVEVELGCKGFGSENMSAITMLKPAQGVEGIKACVLSAIQKAGANACPPMVVGVGIGGSFDYAAMLAKKATLRSCDVRNKDPRYAQLEEELLLEANALKIGPQGLKGDVSVLAVQIEHYPTHIAGLPCAVNISCHATRHMKEVIA